MSSVPYHTHLNVDSSDDNESGDKLSSSTSSDGQNNTTTRMHQPYTTTTTSVSVPRHSYGHTSSLTPPRRRGGKTAASGGGHSANIRSSVQPPVRDGIADAAAKAVVQQRIFPIECHFWYRGGATSSNTTLSSEPSLPSFDADSKTVNAEVWLVRAPLKTGQQQRSATAENNFEIQVFCLDRRIKLETIPLLGLGKVAEQALPRGGAGLMGRSSGMAANNNHSTANTTTSLSAVGAKHDAAIHLSCSKSSGTTHMWLSSVLFAGKAEPVAALLAMLKATYATAQRIRAQHEAVPSKNVRILAEMQRSLDLQERARKLLEEGKFSLQPGGASNINSSAANSPQRDLHEAIDALSNIDSPSSSKRKKRGLVTKRRAIPAGLTKEYLQRCGVGSSLLTPKSGPFVDELSEVESLPSIVISDDEGGGDLY